MKHLIEKTTQLCWATFPCFYKKNDLCTFWTHINVILEKFAEDEPENRDFYQNMINFLIEPCLELDKEKRKLGIRNLLESDYQCF